MKKWAAAIVIISVSILLMEVSLRVLGFYKTYTEKMDGVYISYYDQVTPTHYWHAQPGDSLIDIKPEYTYRSRANNYGFRDRDFTIAKDKNTLRILVLGDSFVQGLGAPADSTWPHLLEGLLDRQDTAKYEVYNCGAAGSDPFYEYMLLKDKLLSLHPDLVIMSMNYSDVNDYITRGGMERFRPDGTTAFSKGPWFEPFYKNCHLVRMFLHFVLRYDFSLLSPQAHQHKEKEALLRLAECADTTHQLCENRGIRFLAVVHPYTDPYDRFLKNQDCLPEMVAIMKEKDVNALDLFGDFRATVTESNYKTYSWPRDMHYTSMGYDLFALIVLKEISASYLRLLHPPDKKAQN